MTPVLSETLAKLPRSLLWAAAGLVVLWSLYVLVFFTTGSALPRSAVSAAINVLPLAGLSLAVQQGLAKMPAGRPVVHHVFLHAALAATFSLLWYGSVVLGHAVLRGFQTGDFVVVGFEGPALAWQSFQGLCLYAVVAALSHALRRTAPDAAQAPADTSPERYLVKVDDALIPIQVADIVCLQGAHDYVQLTTPRGTHLVRHGLSEFGARLPASRFVRIHRSVLVNLDHVQRVEMAGGGKFRVCLSNGAAHTTSRAGAQLLRAMIL